jgi:diguanylate cyclase (GGDEF)-like protein
MVVESAKGDNDLVDIIKKMIAFVGKDTKAKNESKKTIVVIRSILISVLVYFSINVCVGNLVKDSRSLVFYIVYFAIFVGIFVASYKYKSIVVLWMFNIGMLIFILVSLEFFGWNVGVQHFLIVMLMLYFFSGYKRYKEKIAYALGICILRIVLYYIYQRRAMLLPLTASNIGILQIINTITIFWCLSFIAYEFSKDGQELEGKLVEYNEQLEKLANTDKLTGLYNRRKAWDYLETIIKKYGEKSGFSLCICDIDFFKKVNDNYGHDIGDEVLKGVSRIFQDEMKGKDFVARWGGEEFLLLFPGSNGNDAYMKLEDIRNKIKAMRVRCGEQEINITMTFGLAEYDYSENAENTIKEADRKLYLGKESGRNKIVY